MKLLWDTHALLWMFTGDARMGAAAAHLVQQADAQNFVSLVSLWEIAIKLSIKKLEFDKLSIADLVRRMQQEAIGLLHPDPGDCLAVQELPFVHRDPFDRMLAAQASTRSMTMISADPVFEQYGLARIW